MYNKFVRKCIRLGGLCNECHSYIEGMSVYDPLNPDSEKMFYPESDVEIILKCYYCKADIS